MDIGPRFRTLAALTCLLLLGGCGAQSFPSIESADRVLITPENMADTVRLIQDAQAVAALMAFVNERSDGWGGIRDAAGVAIPTVKAYFLRRSTGERVEIVAQFGAGPGYFRRGAESQLATRPADRAELDEFALLLGVPPRWIDEGVPPPATRK